MKVIWLLLERDLERTSPAQMQQCILKPVAHKILDIFQVNGGNCPVFFPTGEMFCKTIKAHLVQESLEGSLWRRLGLLGAGRFILPRTTRPASSDQVGHSLPLTQPASLTPHSLTSLYFLLPTVTISHILILFLQSFDPPTYWSGFHLPGFNEIKRANKKLIRY